ncbi:hypothetical protein AB0H76_05270 [Nocardia sp. NPDC050712]|uniref:hypothetical protein n=1 Tax=Nocardia sp. NPDC050712 TaxID=3155518 RepID=UPI0033C4E1A2
MNRTSITTTLLVPLAFAAAVITAQPARAEAGGQCTGSVCSAPRRIDQALPADSLGPLLAQLAPLTTELVPHIAAALGVPANEVQRLIAEFGPPLAQLVPLTAELVPRVAAALGRSTAELHRLITQFGPPLTQLTAELVNGLLTQPPHPAPDNPNTDPRPAETTTPKPKPKPKKQPSTPLVLKLVGPNSNADQPEALCANPDTCPPGEVTVLLTLAWGPN